MVNPIDKLTTSEKLAFKNLADYLGIRPEWLMFVGWIESKFNSQAINPITRAIGIFQFMPTTLNYLGYSFQQVSGMSLSQQLETVGKKYFLPYKGKIKNIYDCYLAVFYPYAIGKSDEYIFGSEKGMDYAKLVAKQNPLFDHLQKDGLITMKEFKTFVDESFPLLGFKKKIGFVPIVIGLGLLGFLGYRIYKSL